MQVYKFHFYKLKTYGRKSKKLHERKTALLLNTVSTTAAVVLPFKFYVTGQKKKSHASKSYENHTACSKYHNSRLACDHGMALGYVSRDIITSFSSFWRRRVIAHFLWSTPSVGETGISVAGSITWFYGFADFFPFTCSGILTLFIQLSLTFHFTDRLLNTLEKRQTEKKWSTETEIMITIG